jgi:hypothetical protein
MQQDGLTAADPDANRPLDSRKLPARAHALTSVECTDPGRIGRVGRPLDCASGPALGALLTLWPLTKRSRGGQASVACLLWS